jgi:hypothetical protein
MTEQGVRFDSDGCAFVGTCLEAEYPTAAALLITGSGKTGPDRQSIGPRGYSRAGDAALGSCADTRGRSAGDVMMHMLLAEGGPARHGGRLFFAVLPIIVLAIAFDVYCLVDLIRSKSARYLPKSVWGLIIVLVSAPWGGLIYLFVGRDRGQRRSAPP